MCLLVKTFRIFFIQKKKSGEQLYCSGEQCALTVDIIECGWKPYIYIYMYKQKYYSFVFFHMCHIYKNITQFIHEQYMLILMDSLCLQKNCCIFVVYVFACEKV